MGNNAGPLLASGFFSSTGNYLGLGANEDVTFKGSGHAANVFGSAHTTKERGRNHHFSFHDRIQKDVRACLDGKK